MCSFADDNIVVWKWNFKCMFNVFEFNNNIVLDWVVWKTGWVTPDLISARQKVRIKFLTINDSSLARTTTGKFLGVDTISRARGMHSLVWSILHVARGNFLYPQLCTRNTSDQKCNTVKLLEHVVTKHNFHSLSGFRNGHLNSLMKTNELQRLSPSLNIAEISHVFLIAIFIIISIARRNYTVWQ